jgi:sterol desaturase/sphingolipid hydroxylase (fatty acid hydroxylase superfamily)
LTDPAFLAYKTDIRSFYNRKDQAMMDIGTIFSSPLPATENIDIAWMSNSARLTFLLATFAVVFGFELALPLFSRARGSIASHAVRNMALTVVFLGVNLLLSPLSPFATNFVSSAQFGISYWLGLPPLGQLVLGIIGLDLFAYFAHVTMHRIPALWRFHRVHHSDAEVDVTTAFREHPGETLWRIFWHIAGVIVFGTPAWVLITYLTLSAMNGQLEHANIRLPAKLDRWLRLLFVTPNMHKVHHVRHLPETDMNYSNLLSIWDRLGETYSHGPDFASLHYGLDGFDDADKQSVTGLMKMPFMADWGGHVETPRPQQIDRRAA